MLINREGLENTSWRRGPLKTGIGDSNTDRGSTMCQLLSSALHTQKLNPTKNLCGRH